MPARAVWEWLLGRQFAPLDYVLLDPDLTLVSWAEELFDTLVKEYTDPTTCFTPQLRYTCLKRPQGRKAAESERWLVTYIIAGRMLSTKHLCTGP